MPSYKCASCLCRTEHVSVTLAARIVQRNRKTVKNWVSRQQVPYYELPSGRVLICSNCLLKAHPGAVAQSVGTAP